MRYSNVIEAFGEFGSVAEQEVPCPFQRYFFASSGPGLLQGKYRLLQIVTHSVTRRTLV